MTNATDLEPASQSAVLQWAAERRTDLMVSQPLENGWSNLRSTFMRFDPQTGVIQITFPYSPGGQEPEILPGDELGLSFRRGHKKCLFVSIVVLRQADTDAAGNSVDTLVLRAPREIRALQRRAYQRVIVPPHRFIGARLWEGGAPKDTTTVGPICSGRVANISVGGVLVELRVEQNPRLASGDLVGIEITPDRSRQPLMLEGQYKHCLMQGGDRLGLGFQFMGLEHVMPGQATLTQIADMVNQLRREQ